MKLGQFASIIPLKEIPFDYTTLINDDIIQPSDESISLLYKDFNRGYVIVTDNMNDFVDEIHLKQTWNKL